MFKPGQVSKNGGWLVKNSYIDNAYFWLTYESKIADTTAWAFTYAPRETYDFNYYYDNVEEDNALLKLKSCANFFEAKKGTADKDEYIEAVNIGFAGSDVSVKVKVYTNLKGWGQTSVESGFLAAEKTQTFKYGGYNTVKLDTPVKVGAGTYFSVVTEVSNAANNAYVSVVQSDAKKPSFRKVSDGYDTMFYGIGVARIKAYTKLKNAKPDNAEHTFGNLIRKVNATCTETGLKAHYRCADCGKYFDETKTETTLSHLIIAIDPLAHDFDSWVNEIAANCTEAGVKGHKDCKLCGKHFDRDGTELTDLTIAKIGTHQVVVNGENKIYKEGETVTVTADEPQEGKEFKGWQDASGTIVTTDKSYTFTVTGEISLIAVYGDKPEVNPSKNEGLSSGAIAGIVIGSVVFAGIAGFNFVWFAVNKKSFADLLAVIKKIFRRG